MGCIDLIYFIRIIRLYNYKKKYITYRSKLFIFSSVFECMTDELINGPGVESKELAIRVYELYNPELKRFLEIDDRNSYRKGKDFATLDINDLPSIDHSQLTFAAHSIDATLDTEIVFASQSNCSREILTEITQVDVVNLPQPVFDSVFRYHSGYYLVPFGTKKFLLILNLVFLLCHYLLVQRLESNIL